MSDSQSQDPASDQGLDPDVPVTDPASAAGSAEEPGRADSTAEAPAAAAEGEGVAEGEVAAEAEAGAEAPADPAAAVQAQLDERTGDLQRLQAEFLNYKRRVDRDRELLTQNATFKALTPIIEVLDTADRAREAGEVEGGFKAVVDQLERAVAQAGLVRFAAPGDAFDPNLHEALSHLGTDPEVEVTTVKVVAKAGYRIGERVARAAQVLVVDPAEA